ncbi:hypothetical protein KY358_05855 [Candidatus Woesearchaeota archaeon]|nr:hypothetical protein [Candidatus Woesearchaeota archaeon]
MPPKTQISFEYIIIFGFVLLVTIPLLYYALGESSVSAKLNYAEDAVNTLARAADTVYSIGPGTRKYVWINMPGGVRSYSLENKTAAIQIYVFGGLSDVFAQTKADLAGIIPISQGQHNVKVEMTGSGYVLFGEANDTSPPIVIWTSPQGTINYNGIILRATTNEYALCRYDTSDTDYLSMPSYLEGSAVVHEKDLGIMQNGTYTYFVRCLDSSGNMMADSSVINFTIVPPSESNETGNATLPVTNETYEPDPPIIQLISPYEGYIDNDSILLFEYNATDNSSVWFCKLIINNTVDQIDFSITKGIVQNFTKEGLDYGDYSWMVNCSDSHGNTNSSLSRGFKINFSQDTDMPSVTLISPVNNTVRNYWLVGFSYSTTDNTSGIDHCQLHMSGFLDMGGTVDWGIIDSPVVEGQLETIAMPLFKGNYTWNISCVDNSYNANEGYSETLALRVNITAGEEAFLDSCAGICGYNGYSDGVCENNPTKCRTLYCLDCYFSGGDQYCIGGSESDTCCCIP